MFLAAAALLTVALQAQNGKVWGNSPADSVQCYENYNIAGSYYQTKNYIEAYDAWYQVYSTCPGAFKNTFIIAPRILEAKISDTKDAAEKQKLVDLLIKQYDDRLKYFPEKEGYVLGEKAADYARYNKEDSETAYKLFQEAYAAAGNDLTPAQLNSFFLSAVRLFNQKKLEFSELLDVYGSVTEALDYNVILYAKEIAKQEAEKEAGTCDDKCEKALDRNMKIMDGYDKVQNNINVSMGKVLTCDRLHIIYTNEKFEENKENAPWLRSAARNLEKERADEEGNMSDCTDNPIYFKIAEALYKLEPSAQAARSMAKLAYGRKEYNTSIKYYEEAVKLEQDPRVQASDYLKAAVIYQKVGNLQQARSYAQRAANIRKTWGDPYLVIASIYADAAGTCGNNVVEKNAVYWAAIDKLNYAKSIDPSVAGKADKMIAAYKKAAPDKGISFQLGFKEGDKYNIGCWINETVIVQFY